MAEQVRVQFCENGKHTNIKPAIINRNDWAGAMKIAGNKLRIKPKRLFTKEGIELFALDLQIVDKVPENTTLVASAGNDFVGFAKSKDQKEKEANDVVVGLHEKIAEESQFESSQTDPVKCIVRLIAKNSLVEEEAVKQMNATACLPRMRMVVGLPDLHPGKGFPIGSASVSEGVIYPHLVGADIGCGMTLYKTSIKQRKAKLDQWSNSLQGLEQGWQGDASAWLKAFNAPDTEFDQNCLGTIGSGNHFAELQAVEQVVDEALFNSMNIDPESLYLLVHSGSRAYGESVLNKHLDTHGHRGLLSDSEDAAEYMRQHDSAMRWAKANRHLIAHRFLSCLTGEQVDASKVSDEADVTPDGSVRIFDVWHNCVSEKEFEVPSDSGVAIKKLWLHRKGAAPADVGPVVIPGSRGHFSYLVMPTLASPDTEQAAFSLAHGAGRKWNRGKALQMGKAQSKKAEAFTTTELGSRVICENKDLLYEEMPSAYKEIEDIIHDLQEFNLIKVVAILRPIITYKTRVIRYEK